MRGLSPRRSGNTSSLPRSIANDNIIFENPEYSAKLAAGPTSASPGPILLKHATEAVKFVSNPKGSKESSRKANIMQSVYTAK
jgi:hypothetical protein